MKKKMQKIIDENYLKLTETAKNGAMKEKDKCESPDKPNINKKETAEKPKKEEKYK